MTDLIRRLVTWVSVLLFPPGRERLPYAAADPWPDQPLSLPRHRSPYGLDTPLDATASRAVRPYVAAGPCWIHGLEAA